MRSDEVRFTTVKKLFLYQNGNYVGMFDSNDEIDAYLRHISEWMTTDDKGGFLRRRFKDERWTVMPSDMVRYVPVQGDGDGL